ncbi:magnesium transporter [Rhodosalinus sp.]|uniref:magnesium transporter n=1 Tax=Rhodosalinus sp. TaxID=2047741 RepID=UPI003563C2E3
MTDDADQIAPAPETGEEDGYTLDRRRVSAVLYALDTQDRARLLETLDALHPADVADLIEQINPYDRRRFVELAGDWIGGEVLSELEEGLRAEVIGLLQPEVLREAVRALDSDDVVDLLEDLEAEQRRTILGALSAPDRLAVQSSLTYPEYSAGRLMQRELVMAPEHWSVGQAIDHMREREDLPSQFYHVVLVDPAMRPVGNVTLGRIMSSRREVALSELVEEAFRVFPATESETDVAYAFNQYHLISAPVVDEGGRLVGVITIDDAMGVLDEEHEEDLLRLGGVTEESRLTDTVLQAARGRATWLFVNLLTAIFASVVIDAFADTIDQMVALAVLMPIVASMGGNAGTQTMTVAVRAIATRDLTAQNALRVAAREVAVGGLNGALFGLVMAGVAAVWFGVPLLAAVIAVAMLLTQLAAALGGIAIPILLDRLRIDPALASGPFVTTVTDVVGFFTFLGLASMVIL